jgi:hypothetical protein
MLVVRRQSSLIIGQLLGRKVSRAREPDKLIDPISARLDRATNREASRVVASERTVRSTEGPGAGPHPQ